jgi:hypothetical protein
VETRLRAAAATLLLLAVAFPGATLGDTAAFQFRIGTQGSRMYGGMDILLGHSFTPYDSLIYGTGNLIGRNLTFALWGYYGLELFTADRISYCLDSGGGDKENLYAMASSWLGSGFGIKTGMRFCF